jgi:sulfopropanediol 3-dehydrogenase
VTQGIRDTVSKILLDVESEGIAAVRRYSEELDGWTPTRSSSPRRRYSGLRMP